jgi:hypothetical protein
MAQPDRRQELLEHRLRARSHGDVAMDFI